MQPVALHNLDVGAVVVNAQSPYRTVKELVDAAKAKPGELKAATDGLMSADHMATLYFKRRTGATFKLVHFDGGGPATTALAGGHVDVRFGKVGSVYAMLAAGKVRIIGVMDKQRSPYCPEVKTLEEEGFKDYVWYNVTGVSAPKGTPRPIVDILSDAIKKAVDSEEAKKKLAGGGAGRPITWARRVRRLLEGLREDHRAAGSRGQEEVAGGTPRGGRRRETIGPRSRMRPNPRGCR